MSYARRRRHPHRYPGLLSSEGSPERDADPVSVGPGSFSDALAEAVFRSDASPSGSSSASLANGSVSLGEGDGLGDGDADGLGEGDGLADGDGLGDGEPEGEPLGDPGFVGVPELLGLGLGDGPADPLGEGDPLGEAEPSGEGDSSTDGEPSGEGDSSGVGESVGDGEGVSDGSSAIIFVRSTTVGLPSSHGSGSVNWPSTMTSKWRWHPVE